MTKFALELLIFWIMSMYAVDAIGQKEFVQDIPLPSGYTRIPANTTSFSNFLRKLPLKKKGSLVKYFNGASKGKNGVYVAVIDLPIGTKDLHQCADAVMRLRADYLFNNKMYDAIHFNFTNGMKVNYDKWRQGYRIKIKGNKTSWVKTAQPSDSQSNYWKYLEQIWQYAGTSSLSKEMKSITMRELDIGDVFIKGGFPGHAVIVVDKAVNKENEVIFMLAQSYMPAQEIQILQNPNVIGQSPWYNLPIGSSLKTPEWTFTIDQLKRF